MAILDGLFGDNGASDTIKKALENLQSINAPSAESMQVQLQQLVQQGVLTPEQAQAALVSGNAFDSTTADNAGMGSELAALGQLGSMASQGGSDANEKADLANILSQVNAQTKGANDAVLQNQAARGALTSGETLAAQLDNNAKGAQTANSNALNANAAAQSRTMDALKSIGTLGGNVQAQKYGQDANKATAANAIAQFNANQTQSNNQFNTTNKNNAAQTNMAEKQAVSDTNTNNANTNAIRNSNLIQNNFDNQLKKAGATVNESNNLANSQQQVANNSNAFLGNVVGAGGTVAAAAMAKGGVVPGQAPVDGDSPANDVVPARLSPGEVVLPRSVVQHGDPTSVMSFLSRMRKPDQPKTPHPHDVATVLHALGSIRQHHEGGK